MITYGKKLTVKKYLSYYGESHQTIMMIIIGLHSFRIDKHNSHENVCKNHDYCFIEMPEKGNNFNHGEKSMKVLFVIYADAESSLKK